MGRFSRKGKNGASSCQGPRTRRIVDNVRYRFNGNGIADISLGSSCANRCSAQSPAHRHCVKKNPAVEPGTPSRRRWADAITRRIAT
jgi:hypothetical protein